VGEWRRGAVLVPILSDAPQSVVFVERATHLRRHPGQIGFPGGGAEPLDAGDPVRTALRELAEEVGVGDERVSVVGRLPDLEQAMNRFIITPIVGVLDAKTRFAPDGDEIAGVFGVPLASIVSDGAVYEDVAISRARGKTMYALDYEGRHIWGLTGRILKSFVDAWTTPASALRAAVETASASTGTPPSAAREFPGNI
jgi:8-oxo-dGTP pyrophosphatase MutT (NUDIX family)